MRLAALACLAVPLSFAQAPEEPIFRTSTQLVQVDVVVKARNVPVTGLTKDDFEVFDNSQPQKIAIFAVRDAAKVPVSVAPLPEGVISNRPQSRGPEPVSATIILLDSLNTAPQDQAFTRQQVMRYLQKAGPSERIALYHLHTKLDMLQDYTLNRSKLYDALKPFKGSQEYLPAIDIAQTTVNGLRIIARHMEGLEGRKKLIWITSVSLPTLQLNLHNGASNADEMYNPKRFDPLREFNRANVAVYPMDPRGAMTPLGLMDDGILPLQQFAEATGGKAYMLRNDLDSSIEDAVDDTDLTYTLGFYPNGTTAAPNAGQHTIRVNVKRTGVQAHYRTGYEIGPPQEPLTKKQRDGTINTWVLFPLDVTDIPILVSATPDPNKPGMLTVAVRFDIAGVKMEEKNGRFQGNVELAIVPDVEPKTRGLRQTIRLNLTPDRFAAAMQTGALVVNTVRGFDERGKPVAKRLHVVIMDNNTGKAGAVRITLGPELAKR